MHRSSLIVARLSAVAGCVCLFSVFCCAQVSVRSLKFLGAKDAVEIEVEGSDRLVPQTRVLTDPDRLVIDFPNAVPSAELRSQSVDRGQVKDIRVGLFQSKPPVTRLVLDLKAAESYQVFPYGRTVMIKVLGGGGAEIPAAAKGGSPPAPNLIVANYATHADLVSAPAPVEPTLVVSYGDGLLGIRANKATLSEVLTMVQQRTGAEISIPPGAEQEKVVAEIEAAPASEVLARLLNGSRFNFLIVNSADDSRRIDRVILSPRAEFDFVPLAMPDSDSAGVQDSSPVPNPNIATAPPVQPPPVPPTPQGNPPEQSAPNQ